MTVINILCPDECPQEKIENFMQIYKNYARITLIHDARPNTGHQRILSISKKGLTIKSSIILEGILMTDGIVDPLCCYKPIRLSGFGLKKKKNIGKSIKNLKPEDAKTAVKISKLREKNAQKSIDEVLAYIDGDICMTSKNKPKKRKSKKIDPNDNNQITAFKNASADPEAVFRPSDDEEDCDVNKFKLFCMTAQDVKIGKKIVIAWE